MLYLSDLETVIGANHGQGQGTGSKKEELGRSKKEKNSRRQGREHGWWIDEREECFCYFSESGQTENC